MSTGANLIMGLPTFAAISGILLVLCLAVPGCQGTTDPFNPDQALALARDAADGKLGPDFKPFNVLDYGVKLGDNVLNTIGFTRAWKAACDSTENAIVVIPEGNFITGPIGFSGPCNNPSPVIVLLKGTLTAKPDLTTFTANADDNIDTQDWLTFRKVQGLILTGTGTLHGQGEKGAWESKNKDKNNRLPASVKFIDVRDVIVRGLTSINPKGFHIFISTSSNFRIFNLKLQAPAESPNTDGIHMSKSTVVKIANSDIATGDDCVSIIHGTKDISVKKVRCGPGHGFSVGSLGHYEDEEDVSDIIVTNCSMTETDNGLRIKTYRNNNPSTATGIYFRDIIMDRVKNPIIIDQEYGDQQSSQGSKVSIKDVFFKNIVGTTISKRAVQLGCSSAVPCQGIHLNNVNLNYVGGPDDDPFQSVCNNVKVDYSGIQSPDPCP